MNLHVLRGLYITIKYITKHGITLKFNIATAHVMLNIRTITYYYCHYQDNNLLLSLSAYVTIS